MHLSHGRTNWGFFVIGLKDCLKVIIRLALNIILITDIVVKLVVRDTTKVHDLWFIVLMKFTEVAQQEQIGITLLQCLFIKITEVQHILVTSF